MATTVQLPTYQQVAAIQSDVTSIKTTVEGLAAKFCDIVVTCTTTDNVTVTGQTVTLRAGTSASAVPYDTRAYNGQPVTFQVPMGFRYFVEVSPTLADHYAPTTATGTVTATTVNVTLTYSDISNITTFAGVKAVVNACSSVAEGRAALVGLEIADTWTADDGLTEYSDPKRCIDVREVKDANGVTHLAAIMQCKYASHNAIPFDAPERDECDSTTETVAENLIWYYGCGATYDPTATYAVNAYCGYNGNLYKCTTAVTTAEAFDEDKWALQSGPVSAACVALSLSTGSEIPYSSYYKVFKSSVTSNLSRFKEMFDYGYNRWSDSAWRIYANSDEAVGLWYHKPHAGACAPAIAPTTRGYKAGCSAALLEHAKPIAVKCYANSVTDSSDIYETIDTFWLCSGAEMYGVVNDFEGDPFKYFIDATGWSSASNSGTNGRKFYKVSATGSAVDVRLRSAIRGGAGNACYVYSNGGLGNSTASAAYAGVPACAIY